MSSVISIFPKKVWRSVYARSYRFQIEDKQKTKRLFKIG